MNVPHEKDWQDTKSPIRHSTHCRMRICDIGKNRSTQAFTCPFDIFRPQEADWGTLKEEEEEIHCADEKYNGDGGINCVDLISFTGKSEEECTDCELDDSCDDDVEKFAYEHDLKGELVVDVGEKSVARAYLESRLQTISRDIVHVRTKTITNIVKGQGAEYSKQDLDLMSVSSSHLSHGGKSSYHCGNGQPILSTKEFQDAQSDIESQNG